jgi:hypothetical protein
MDQKRLLRHLPFAIGFAAGPILIWASNLYSLATMYEPYKICFDCGRTAGFPFTMYNSGYLWGGEGYIASGVFANTCVALILGGVFGFLSIRIWRLIAGNTRTKGFK